MFKLTALTGLVLMLTGCVATLSATPITADVQPANVQLQTQAVSSESCKSGGWQTMRTREGETFKNQGQCIKYYK